MKKLLPIMAMLLASPISAQNYLTIIQKNGYELSFGFIDKPIITYTENDLVLTTDNTTVQFPVESLLKFIFTDQPTGVPVIESRADLKVLDKIVTLTGLKAETQVKLISTDGKIIASYKSSPNGTLSFSIAELPVGTYIIKSESITCKIMKR